MAPFDETLFLKKSVEVLSFFNEDQLRQVTPDIERSTYNKGQSVLLRGEISSCFYILKKGKAEATYKAKGQTKTVELMPGDFFGEISLVEDMPSDASIKAAEDETGRHLRLELEDLEDRTARYPHPSDLAARLLPLHSEG